jgi:uncharacterized protein YcsI (UPF0317 family)
MKLKVALILCATAVSVLGCANPAERRAGTADLEVKSVRSAKDMAMCIAEKWEVGPLGGSWAIAMRPIPNGYTVSLAQASNIFADVKETPDGSFTRMFGDPFSEGFQNDVKKCASEK